MEVSSGEEPAIVADDVLADVAGDVEAAGTSVDLQGLYGSTPSPSSLDAPSAGALEGPVDPAHRVPVLDESAPSTIEGPTTASLREPIPTGAVGSTLVPPAEPTPTGATESMSVPPAEQMGSVSHEATTPVPPSASSICLVIVIPLDCPTFTVF